MCSSDLKARILVSLNKTLTTLQGTDANSHATDAVSSVISTITSGDTGLNKATDVVTSAPGAITPMDRPSATDHPSRP